MAEGGDSQEVTMSPMEDGGHPELFRILFWPARDILKLPHGTQILFLFFSFSWSSGIK